MIGTLADRYAAETSELLFAQIARCSRAQLVPALVEFERVADLSLLARDLGARMRAALPAQSAEDWPLLLALRELELEPRARDGLTPLNTLAVRYAASAAQANQRVRASRLMQLRPMRRSRSAIPRRRNSSRRELVLADDRQTARGHRCMARNARALRQRAGFARRNRRRSARRSRRCRISHLQR